jgi:hypothetical protein
MPAEARRPVKEIAAATPVVADCSFRRVRTARRRS